MWAPTTREYTQKMRSFTATFAFGLSAGCFAPAFAPNFAPPLKLATSTLDRESAAAARVGQLDAYLAALSSSLHDALDGKAPKVTAKFAATDAGAFALLQWRLLNQLSPEARAALGTQHADTMAWLLSNREPLELFLTSGDIMADRWSDATRILCEIVGKDAAATTGLPLRLAVATALVFSTPVTWMADGSAIDPIKRYESYRKWDAEGVLFTSFRDLSAWELRYVVGSWSSDEDLVWARAHIKDELRARDRVGDAAHMLAYIDTNKNGVSVQAGGKFYDNKPMTLAIMLEYGGVCGAISRFGTSMAQAFGVPAMPIGQPGHCAFLWQKSPHTWSINNDVSGWAESGCHGGIHITWGHPAWLVPLMQEAQSDRADFVASEVLRAAAAFAVGSTRDALLAQACTRCPKNYGAWTERVRALTAGGRGYGSDGRWRYWNDAANEVAAAFRTQPMAYSTLLATIQPGLMPPRPRPAVFEERALDAAKALAAMAQGGADSGLVAFALRDVLARHAEGIAPDSAVAARAIALGVASNEASENARLTAPFAASVVDLCLAATNALDVAQQGPAHDAWTKGLHRLIDGIVSQPAARAYGISRLEAMATALMKSNRAGDARWIADRVVDAAKSAKDPAFEAKAAAFRATLG